MALTMVQQSQPAVERRHGERKPLAVLVQYRFEAFESFVADYSANLSPSGIFIQTDQPKGLGEPVFLQFTDRAGSELIEGLGTVVRISRPGSSLSPAGMGIRFLSLDDASMARIEQFCEGEAASRKSTG